MPRINENNRQIVKKNKCRESRKGTPAFIQKHLKNKDMQIVQDFDTVEELIKNNDVILNNIKVEKRKAELTKSIITWLTESPDSIEKELISNFFTIANDTPTDKTVSAFQLLWYVLNDAKELKKLMQNEG